MHKTAPQVFVRMEFKWQPTRWFDKVTEAIGARHRKSTFLSPPFLERLL
jgi:hypothetical protein